MRSKPLLALVGALMPFLLAPSAIAASSVTDRLSGDHAAIEVTSEPPGTTELHIAVMADLAGDGIRYLNLPASQTTYTPPSGTPVVDVQALGLDGTLGGWAGRLQSTPSSASEEPAHESPPEATSEALAEEAQAELQEELGDGLGASVEAEAQRTRTKPKKKKPAEEPPQEPPPSAMVIGVDSGGWPGGSTFSDLYNGGIRYVRTTSGAASYVEPEASRAGVHIATVIFGTGGSIGAINASSYASEIKSYFTKYGHSGGLAVEVLNEPGNRGFWSDPTAYSAYAKLAKAVHEALLALPVTSRPAELCSWDGGEASPNPNKPWGQGIKAAGALPYCDGVTVHPYGGNNGGDGGALGGRRDVELAHAESNKPVDITEIGWPTAVGQSPTGDSQQWSEAQQASNISGFMQWASVTGYVPMAIYFNYVDYGSNDFYGIETKARKHKLGFAALAQASAKW